MVAAAARIVAVEQATTLARWQIGANFRRLARDGGQLSLSGQLGRLMAALQPKVPPASTVN